jgi:hypothetical protein
MLLADENESFAQVVVNYANIGSDARRFMPLESSPFTKTFYKDGEGIHLHWIMPDELTQGVVDEESGTVEYPRLPNKWIVTRMWVENSPLTSTKTDDTIHRERFIVESNVLNESASDKNFNRRSSSYPWTAGGTKPYRFLGRSAPSDTTMPQIAETDENLNALSSGNPYFTAYYAYCRNVFGFHDELLHEGRAIKNLKLTYNVCGWYDYKEKKDDEGIVCHGMICDIVWNGGPTHDFYSGHPRIAVGNTSEEAAAALYNTNSGDEWLCHAFLTDNLIKADLRDGVKDVEKSLHETKFGVYRIPFRYTELSGEAESNGDGKIKQLDGYAEKIRKLDETAYGYSKTMYEYWLGYRYYKTNPNPAFLKICTDKINGCMLAIQKLKAEIFQCEKKINELMEGTNIVSIPDEKFWEPNNPVVLIDGLNRGVSHGYDGRFSNDGVLKERRPGEIITSLTLKADGETGLANDITIETTGLINHHRSFEKVSIDRITKEVIFMLEGEAAILSTSFCCPLAKKALVLDGKKEREITEEQISGLGQVINVLQTKPFAYVYTKQDDNNLAAEAGFNGEFPSKTAVNYYTGAWSPLLLEWNVEYFADKAVLAEEPSIANWRLGEQDFEYIHEYIEQHRFMKVNAEGRTVITPHLPETMDGMIKKQMNNMKTDLKYADILSQLLDGLHDRLLMRGYGVPQPIFYPSGDTVTEMVKTFGARGSDKMIIDDDFFSPVRAGFMVIKRLRVIDNFGRFKDIATDAAIAGSMKSNKKDYIMLPPRILQGARLNFTWCKHDSHCISGWLVPNFNERRLTFYNINGDRLGYLRAGTKIEFIRESSIFPSGLDAIINRFLNFPQNEGLLNFGLFMESAADALNHINAPANDVVSGTVSYVGPLLALASADIGLEICSPSEQYKIPELIKETGSKTREINLEKSAFPARIGDIDHNGDGVAGFFDKNFDVYHTSFGDHGKMTNGGFFSDDMCLHLNPSFEKKTVNINLIIIPTAEVHVTTGILPQVRAAIPPQEVSAALENMMYSIFTAPVLSAPDIITLPYADTKDIEWRWQTPSGELKTLVNAGEQAINTQQQAFILEGRLIRTRPL